MISFRLLLLVYSIELSAQTVNFGVFGLFHPTILTVRPASNASIVVQNGSQKQILEGLQTATFTLASIARATVSSPASGPAEILLSVPGKIERRYRGIVRITREGRELVPVVEMDREAAVASIVAAEIAPGAPLEALKAQAVLARSFLAASRGRHRNFEFCDTTHCQFIRAYPGAESGAGRAASGTRDRLLTFQGTPFAPLYSATCGGHTRDAVNEAGSHGYRYRSVVCAYCLRTPAEPVRGHRLGMCQLGASAMAQAGAGYREILNYYYPGASVVSFSPR